MAMTTRGLAAIQPGEWQTAGGNKGAGRLAAFGMKAGGAAFYFRYTKPDGTRDSLPIGHFDAKGRDGLTLQQASNKAADLSKRYQSGERDLRAVIDAETREAERLRNAELADAAADAALQRATLGAMLSAYVAQLRRDGKPSARAVERALALNMQTAWPVLWDTPADSVTADDLLSVIAKLADAGKLREAAKLRAYLRAAYAAAIRARQDARALPALRTLRVTVNPARDLVTIEGATKARERALSLAELREYWTRICALDDPSGALLRFHLLTGAQRVEQLGRLTTDDFDVDLNTVRIRDGKGRRKVARIHDVPLIPSAADAMKAMRTLPKDHESKDAKRTDKAVALGPFLFTVTYGESGAVYSTVQHRVREVVAAMQAAGELEKGPFTVGDLRRTVETRLSAAGVGVDVRAQLQSHGLGGVQARHYDRHDYLSEKLAALETLYELLTGKGATVTPIRKRKAS